MFFIESNVKPLEEKMFANYLAFGKGEKFLEKNTGALDYGCLPVYFPKFQKNSF